MYKNQFTYPLPKKQSYFLLLIVSSAHFIICFIHFNKKGIISVPLAKPSKGAPFVPQVNYHNVWKILHLESTTN